MARPLPPHDDVAQAAIAAELVRLTLPHAPHTDRRELRLRLPDPTAARRRRRRPR